MQKEGKRKFTPPPRLQTAEREVLPKGDPPLASESEVGQLRLLEKCLSMDEDGAVYIASSD